jgi:hypothetical protein
MKQVSFPIWRLRKCQQIKTNPLGLTKLKTGKGWFILDDKGIPGDTLAERRLRLINKGKKKNLYKLTEQVNYMRQMFKYKTKTNFIDSKGLVFTYVKSSGLNQVVSRKIIQFAKVQSFNVFIVEGVDSPFLVDYELKDRGIKFASIMQTRQGPFLYDLTKDYHEHYRRKI